MLHDDLAMSKVNNFRLFALTFRKYLWMLGFDDFYFTAGQIIFDHRIIA